MLEGGKWGYVNPSGDVVIRPKYDCGHDFSDGLARDGFEFINRSGKTALTVSDGLPGNFREGLCPVDATGVTRFIDHAGKTRLIVPGHAEEFHEGMAAFRIAGKVDPDGNPLFGFIDMNGVAVIEPRFTEINDFSEGLAAVRAKKATTWKAGDELGYIDKTGKYQIGPQFNVARPFHGGIAYVHVGGELQRPRHFRRYWVGGEWWLIDSTGKKLMRSYVEQGPVFSRNKQSNVSRELPTRQGFPQIVLTLLLVAVVGGMLYFLAAESRLQAFFPVTVRASRGSDTLAERYFGFGAKDLDARNVVVVSGPFSLDTGLTASLFFVQAGSIHQGNAFTVGRSRNRLGTPWLNFKLALGEAATSAGPRVYLGCSRQPTGAPCWNSDQSPIPRANVRAARPLPGKLKTGKQHIVFVEGDSEFTVDREMALEEFAKKNKGNYVVIAVQINR
jgi:hypothetical protein